MTQQPASSSNANEKQGSALDREAERVDGMTPSAPKGEQPKDRDEGAQGLNNPVQIEQDNRNDKARADAKAAGGGPAAGEDGLNQDG